MEEELTDALVQLKLANVKIDEKDEQIQELMKQVKILEEEEEEEEEGRRRR